MELLTLAVGSSREAVCLGVVLSLALDVLGSEGGPTPSGDHLRVRKCEPIRVDTCQGFGYNVTGLPNLIGHESQTDADLQLRTFNPLIQYGCSGELRFFLCAVYAPMCTEKVVDVIGPCRSVCEKVRDRCEPVLRQFGFPWPAALNCSKFHPFNDNQRMCMEGTLTSDESPGKPDPRRRPPASQAPQAAPPHPVGPVSVVPGRIGTGSCEHLPHPEKFVFSNRTRQCLQLCDADLSFAQRDKTVLDVWMAVWSSVGIASTAVVAATYLVDVQRFRATERHVVFMTLCYGMCSVAYLIRVVAGRRAISCVTVDSGTRDQPSSVLAKSGLASTDCTILFVLLYYFSMAGIVWWLVLTFTWLFVAGLHWTADATAQRLATYFHIVAWSVPAVQVIVILVRKSIEPNEVTGMCHVTANESVAVVGFLLAPMVAFLFIGATFLGGGLLGYYRTRQRGGRGGTVGRGVGVGGVGGGGGGVGGVGRGGGGGSGTPRADDESESTNRDLVAVTRVATFCIVCALPLLGAIACVLYGYINIERAGNRDGVDQQRTQVERDANTEPARDGAADDDPSQLSTNHRSVSVFLIQVLANVVVSVFSAFRTVRSAEAKQSWRQFFRRRRCAPPEGGAATTNGQRRCNPCPLDFPSTGVPTGNGRATPSVRSYRRSPLSDYDKQRLGLIPPHPVQLAPHDHQAKRCRTCNKHRLLSRPFQYVI